MSQSSLAGRYLAGIIVAFFFGIALYLRIALPYDYIFSGDGIKFSGVDAYYHMRLVDNLLHHFPHHIAFDPYTFYPRGMVIPWPPMFDWLIAAAAWLIGLGSPTAHTVDVVGVYFPAILGALAVIPVYFIGKQLFNRWIGVISSGLIALLPGEFLFRSMLGFTDHHVAEVLFTTVSMLFLILAVRTALQKELAFSHLRYLDFDIIARPVVYSLLSGIFLGIYLLTWVGGLLFVLLLFIAFATLFIIDHLRGKSTEYLGIIGTLSFLIASVISLPLLPQSYLSTAYLVSLPIAAAAPVVLAGISRVMYNRKLAVAYYPLSLVVLGASALAVAYAIDPAFVDSMVGQFNMFFPSDVARTVLEIQPILFPNGNFSFSVVWGNFTTGFFLSFIALGLLIYHVIKRGEADKTLLIVWSLLILAATFGQRRFAYYLAINVALLTGYLSWYILEFAGFGKRTTDPVKTPIKEKKPKRKARRAGTLRLANSRVSMALGAIVIFFLVFFPNIKLLTDIDRSSWTGFAPSDAWFKSLSWLKDNTPEPFGDPDFYYELYEPPPAREAYDYPESAYGIIAWWHYGHWITRIAHRIPNRNPFIIDISKIAGFLITQDEASSLEKISKLGSRYIILDYAMATSGFHYIPTWAGSSKEEFYGDYYELQQGKFEYGRLYYPEYYRSLSTRLYNFNGSEVIPESTGVMSYELETSHDSEPYKKINSARPFSTYEQAEEYISDQKSGNWRIVSNNPFVSPVPLEELQHYKLIYSSDDSISDPVVGETPQVKIFEYVK
ncbi:oligosaccharyl transferase, archaeosortase A system-associated [Chloroflexota bacterium]